MNAQRSFVSLVAVVTSVAIPAWGQVMAPGVGPDRSVRQGATSIPDFSGIWAHLTWPDFEPPISGPGPVTNRSRRDGAGNNYELVGDYTNPILKPHAAEVVKRHGEISLTGVPYPTPSNQCWPGGMPFVLWNIGMQMLQKPDKIAIIYSNDHEVRYVRMNQPHPARVPPSWYGDSVGHYEGDTLVIDTVGVKADRPFAMVDMYGTPFTEALHVVERYRMVDYDEAQAAVARNLKENSRVPDTASDLTYRGKRLQVIFTVEDEGAFTMPWSGGITYERPAMAWEENVCAENPFDFFAGKNDAFVPTADKPDF